MEHQIMATNLVNLSFVGLFDLLVCWNHVEIAGNGSNLSCSVVVLVLWMKIW